MRTFLMALAAIALPQIALAMTPEQIKAMADKNWAEAQALIAGGERDKAFVQLSMACQLGQTAACGPYGEIMLEGRIIARDPVKARESFATGCGGGDAVACNSLAIMQHDGDGIPADLPGAAANYTLACDGGVASACSAIGLFYESGFVDTAGAKHQDIAEAVVRYGKACDGDDFFGCALAGVAYLGNKGIPCDHARVTGYFQRAFAIGAARPDYAKDVEQLHELADSQVSCPAPSPAP